MNKCTFPLKILLLLFLTGVVTACGFRLRGNYDFPPQLKNIYVTSIATNDYNLISSLRQQLANAHMSLSPSFEEADYILRITHVSNDSSLQSSSTTGQINTYNLVYTVNFNLKTKTGETVLADQSVQSSTQFTMGSNQLLTSFNQDANYTQELQQAAINQILFRLSSKNIQKTLATFANTSS